MYRWVSRGGGPTISSSVQWFTLVRNVETFDLFHPSIFDYVIIWKSCGWKIFRIFQLQRLTVVWPLLVTCFFIACFLGMNDHNIIIVTLQNFYRSSRRSDELWLLEKSSKKWSNHRGSLYKRTFLPKPSWPKENYSHEKFSQYVQLHVCKFSVVNHP